MAGRLVTVFGGSGFIGRHVVRRLARAGWRVNAAVRDAEKAKFLRPMGDVGQVVPLRAPITDDRLVTAACAGADVVINLVGILAESRRGQFDRIHHRGAARVAAAAAAGGASRMIHVSAIGADPRSPAAYGRSKAAGEAAVRAAYPDAVIFRPSIVFGPEDSFFNRFATMARMAPGLPLIGGGETRLQPVYVGDVADAVMRAVDEPQHAGRTYELGGPRAYSFRELMELMLAEMRIHRGLVPLPFPIAELMGMVLEWVPGQPLTRDQVVMLKRDNVVSDGALGLKDLAIEPTALEAIIPTYLDRFRIGGQWSDMRA